MINHRKITRLLVNCTKDVMLPRFEKWIEEKSPGTKLKLEMGKGKSTYHQKTGRNRHKIVFGIEMARCQIRSQLEASSWTHGREIIDRKYFGGDLDLKNVFVAVLLHEFSHFVQTLSGGRTYNSVHNDKFYEILDWMYEKGYDQLVMNYLMQHKEFAELKYESDITEKEASKYHNKNIKNGMKVKFKGREKVEISGIVEKVNPKRIKLKVEGGHYMVPYQLITYASF